MSSPHEPLRLQAAGGLAVTSVDGAWHLAWEEPDWLGPIGLRLHVGGRRYQAGVAEEGGDRSQAEIVGTGTRVTDGADGVGSYHAWEIEPAPGLPLRAAARAYVDRPVLVFRLEAARPIDALATGHFARPSAAWPVFFPARRAAHGIAEGSTTYAQQWTEFALPVFGDASCSGFFLAPHRPPALGPLLFIAPDGRTLLLGALDHFHEQVIALPGEGEQGVACGWHGDLASVPAGFATELGVFAAPGPRQALDAWGGELLRRYGTRRPSRYADAVVGMLSYWTDNGAHYYYRTEPGCDYATTLERAVAEMRSAGIPIASVQLDSWFYPHEHSRPVSDEGAPLVPPSGLVRWEPRDDLFPEGFARLRERLGNLPLIFHSRHFSARSPYFEQHAAWVDGDYAHPKDEGLHAEMLARAAGWGAVTYEQDWMVESFLGVRGLREAPGRARAWQEALDRIASRHGLTLQWCMSSPADFLQTLTLERVTSIRTSGDYRYLFDNGFNWVWFLHGNALARALGLNPFKDVFLSPASGEPYAEVEALLAALSAGPVGIGDRIGATDRDLVLRTCREDGVLVKPDAPLAAVDRCFRASAFLQSELLTAETYSEHPAGRWIYVVTLHASRERAALSGRLCLQDLGAARPAGRVVAYDWRRRTWSLLEPDGDWEVELPFQDWDFRVLCPLLPGDRAVFGDIDKYASAGDRRIAGITADGDTISFEVLGAPDTSAVVAGCSPRAPAGALARGAGGERRLAVTEQPAGANESCQWRHDSGIWKVRVDLREAGAVKVVVGW